MKKKRVVFFVILSLILLIGKSYGDSVHLKEGIDQYRDENYEEALELFKKAKEEKTDSTVVEFYMGLTYKQTGELEKAQRHFEASLEMSPPVYDSFTELIEILYIQNKFKEAWVWIKRAEELNIHPAKIAFLKGMVLSKTNKRRKAIESFERSKELDKSVTQAADLQIALNYAAMNKFKKAAASLDNVIETDPQTELASFAAGYKKSVESGAKRYKTWRFTIGVSSKYDDNVVLSPSNTSGELSAADRVDGAIMNSFSINYQPTFDSENWFFNANYNIFNLYYFEVDEYNAIVNSLTLNPGYRINSDVALTTPINATYSFLDKDGYMSTLSIKPTVHWMFHKNNVGQFYAGFERRFLLGRIYDRDEDRDSNIYIGGLAYILTFMESKGMLNLRYEFRYDDTQGKNWKNRGNKVGLGLYMPLIGRLALMTTGEIFYQRYENVHTVLDVKRSDTFLSGTVNLAYQVLKPLYLNIIYSHTTANSNIFVYDYKRNIYSGGVEYRF